MFDIEDESHDPVIGAVLFAVKNDNKDYVCLLFKHIFPKKFLKVRKKINKDYNAEKAWWSYAFDVENHNIDAGALLHADRVMEELDQNNFLSEEDKLDRAFIPMNPPPKILSLQNYRRFFCHSIKNEKDLLLSEFLSRTDVIESLKSK